MEKETKEDTKCDSGLLKQGLSSWSRKEKGKNKPAKDQRRHEQN